MRMRTTGNLNRKLIALLLFSIGGALVIAGIVLSLFFIEYNKQQVQKDFDRFFHEAREQIKATQQELRKDIGILAQNPNLISSTNVISRYSDINNYNALIFDAEKSKITDLISNFSVASGIDHIAIYDREGRLISYAESDEHKIKGYITYQEGKPLILEQGINSNQKPVIKHEDSFWSDKLIIETEITNVETNLVITDHGAGIRVTAPIYRTYPDKKEYMTGFISISRYLNESFLKQLPHTSGIKSALYSKDRNAIIDSDFQINPAFFNNVTPLANISSHKLIMADNHLIEAHEIRLIPNTSEKLYLVAAVHENQIAGERNYVLAVIAFVFILSGVLVVPAGILFSQKTITQPVSNLSMLAEHLKKGNYHLNMDKSLYSSSEFELLANTMIGAADKIRERENELTKARDELEERVEERTTELARTNTQLEGEIKEKQQTEEELRKAVKSAAIANEAKSDFLSNMSHELRTPLNAILGFSELLQIELSDKDKVAADNAGEIIAAGQHLLHLIDEILDLSKIEAGKLDINIEETDLQQTLRESFNFVEKIAKARDIKFNMDMNKFRNIYLRADPTRLKQVLVNLFTNAIKYNKANGEVTVTYETADNGMGKVSVTDTGIGISQKDMQELFKPFTRFTKKKHIEGTGIGLVITRQIIEMMNGKLEVESTPGEGSTFSFMLPASTSGANNADNTSIRKYSISHENSEKTIYYIEDNRANRELVRNIFRQRTNLNLETFESAEEGLEKIKIHKPDLVLMDISLPGMSGTEAVSILKADSETSHIPVVAVSAKAMEEDIKDAMQYGFDAYLTKPIDINSLLQTVERFITE